MPNGEHHPLLWEPYKKETPHREGSGFMPATGRDVVVLPTKKGGTADLAGNINYETGKVHSSMEAVKTEQVKLRCIGA